MSHHSHHGHCEEHCEPPLLKVQGMLAGCLLLVLFVRLLNDPHLPPPVHELAALTAVLGMGRIACLGSRWLVKWSPVHLPPGCGLRDKLAKVLAWLGFGVGLPMAGFTTLALATRLGGPGRPPPLPPQPPPPEFLGFLAPLQGGPPPPPPPPGEPGIVLGMALMFVPTALICLAAAPWAWNVLRQRELLRGPDAWAVRVGALTIGYSLALIWFMSGADAARVREALWQMLSIEVLPLHCMAAAAASGVWRVWFFLRSRGLFSAGGDQGEPAESPSPPDPGGGGGDSGGESPGK